MSLEFSARVRGALEALAGEERLHAQLQLAGLDFQLHVGLIDDAADLQSYLARFIAPASCEAQAEAVLGTLFRFVERCAARTPAAPVYASAGGALRTLELRSHVDELCRAGGPGVQLQLQQFLDCLDPSDHAAAGSLVKQYLREHPRFPLLEARGGFAERVLEHLRAVSEHAHAGDLAAAFAPLLLASGDPQQAAAQLERLLCEK